MARTAPMVARMSSDNATGERVLSPFAIAAQMTERCAALFEGGTRTVPQSFFGVITTLLIKDSLR
jgi:hypothetical protein